MAEIVQETRNQPGDAWSEILPHLGRALEQLSPGRREAVIQVYLEGRSQTEVARTLGCSVPAIRVRLSEGLHLLRDQLSRCGVAYGSVIPLATVLNDGMATASGATIGGKSVGIWTLKTWWSGFGTAGKIGLTGAGTIAAGVACVTVIAVTTPGPTIDKPMSAEPVAEAAATDSPASSPALEANPQDARPTINEPMPAEPIAEVAGTNPPVSLPAVEPNPQVSRRATLEYDGDPWVWKGHQGRWVWKPGIFRPTMNGKTQYWWHWDS